MTYPFGSLAENLVAFSSRLRRQHRFHIGPREIHDAARALLVTRLEDERAVRDVLRPVFCSSAADVAVFDRAFDEFFHPVAGPPESRLERVKPSPADEKTGLDERAGESQASRVPLDVGDADEEASTVLRASYSPLDGEGTAPELTRADAAWRAAAHAFVAALRAGLSRRWRPARHGQRFDLRRTLRHSLHTGGEPVMPRWQTRLRRRPHIVLLIDGSRSMSDHANIALDMAIALASATSNLEVFAFSTTLQRITRDVRRAAAGEPRSLEHLRRAWGGGTSIGLCLRAFLQQFGERLLGRYAFVMIVSDGLDVGASGVLRDAMARLKRESAAVLWLNPLLETPGYEPSALGMSIARPFVSTLACVGDPARLRQLAREVRLRS